MDHDDLVRNLKSQLLEAERYREEYREVAEILAMLKVGRHLSIWASKETKKAEVNPFCPLLSRNSSN